MALTTSYDGKTRVIQGLSSDPKPTDGIENGSVFYEMDTHKLFMFDAANVRWIEQ